MSLFSQFKTNPDLEKAGVVYTPTSTTAITIARAGGANVRFAKVIEGKTKPYRRQIETGTLEPGMDRKLMIETYAEAVIKNWESLVDTNANLVDAEPKWELVQGIEADPSLADKYEGKIIDGLAPFNKTNVIVTLNALPDLFLGIQEEAQRVANFRDMQTEADAGN